MINLFCRLVFFNQLVLRDLVGKYKVSEELLKMSLKPIENLPHDARAGDVVRLVYPGGGEFVGKYVGEVDLGVQYIRFRIGFDHQDDMKFKISGSYHDLSKNTWTFAAGPTGVQVTEYEILKGS